MVLRAQAERLRDEHDRQRSIAYELAGLICFALNDPRKMPKFEPTRRARAAGPMVSSEADDARVRAYLIARSTQIQQGG